MIISAIIVILLLSLIFIITVPFILISYLRTIFTTVQMKLYSPVSLRGILFDGFTSSWGLTNMTIFIQAIELGWSPNSFKVRLNFSNIQLYLRRRITSLSSVNLIDGNQQANIIYNFADLLFDDMKDSKGVQSKSIKKNNIWQQGSNGTTSYFFEGITHLFLIFIMRTFEVVLTDCNIFIVSGLPDNMIHFETKQQRKQSLRLMQWLSQYSVQCNLIRVNQEIEHHNSYKLVFKTDEIIANCYSHYEDNFISMNKVQMQVIVPFSMSLSKSLKQIKFIFSIKEANVNIIASDFQHFFQLIKQLNFDINRKNEASHQQSSQKQLCLTVDNIRVCMKDIFQVEFDNAQAKQYLSSVSKSTIQLNEFCLSQKVFSIATSTLLITKFCKQSNKQQQMKILKIKNLQILDTYIHTYIITNDFSSSVFTTFPILDLLNHHIIPFLHTYSFHTLSNSYIRAYFVLLQQLYQYLSGLSQGRLPLHPQFSWPLISPCCRQTHHRIYSLWPSQTPAANSLQTRRTSSLLPLSRQLGLPICSTQPQVHPL